jgi:hypothetical protein
MMKTTSIPHKCPVCNGTGTVTGNGSKYRNIGNGEVLQAGDEAKTVAEDSWYPIFSTMLGKIKNESMVFEYRRKVETSVPCKACQGSGIVWSVQAESDLVPAPYSPYWYYWRWDSPHIEPKTWPSDGIWYFNTTLPCTYNNNNASDCPNFGF